MMIKTGVLLFLGVLLLGCKTKEWVGLKYDSDTLKINRIYQTMISPKINVLQ